MNAVSRFAPFKLNPKTLLCLFFASLNLIYLATKVPNGLQLLDSSEFLTAAVNGTTVHPPGYPLYLWISSIWAEVLKSALDEKVSLAYLSLVFYSAFILVALHRIQSSAVSYLAVILPLASNAVIAQYAITSDVFSLHGMLVGLIAFVFLSEDSARRSYTLLFLGVLSTTNHHTVVFLAPLFLYDFVRHFSKKYFRAVIASGLLILSIYSSLLLRDTQSLDSWPTLNGWGDLLGYFLREDYGTGQLSINPQRSELIQLLWHFLEKFGLSCLGSLAIIMVGWRLVGRSERLKGAILLVSIFGYLVFWIFWVRADTRGEAGEILSRFYIMPIFLLTTLASQWIKKVDNFRYRAWLFGLSIAVAIANFPATSDRLNAMANATVDLVLNDIFAAASRQPNNLVVVRGDSIVFGIRAKLAEFPKENLIVVPTGLICKRSFQKRLKDRVPYVKFEKSCDGEKNQAALNFVSENVMNYPLFVVDEEIFPIDNVQVQVFNTGIQYNSGKHQVQFRLNRDLLSQFSADTMNLQFDPFLEIEMLSARGTLIYARFLFAQGSFEQSLTVARTVLERFPAHFAAREVACRSLKLAGQANEASNCEHEFVKLMKVSYPYFIQDEHLKGQ